jgi:hypothetical protein
LRSLEEQVLGDIAGECVPVVLSLLGQLRSIILVQNTKHTHPI